MMPLIKLYINEERVIEASILSIIPVIFIPIVYLVSINFIIKATGIQRDPN